MSFYNKRFRSSRISKRLWQRKQSPVWLLAELPKEPGKRSSIRGGSSLRRDSDQPKKGQERTRNRL